MGRSLRWIVLVSVATPALALVGCEGVTGSGGQTGMGGAGTGGAASGGGGTGAGGGTASGGANGSGGATGTGGAPARAARPRRAARPAPTAAPAPRVAAPPPGRPAIRCTPSTSAPSRGTYIVGLPTGYNASKPQRLVFAFHGRTGTAMQIAGTGTAGTTACAR